MKAAATRGDTTGRSSAPGCAPRGRACGYFTV